MAEEAKFTAPYVPFPTFTHALDLLAGLGAIPPKIDHTVFPSMNGVSKGQVISAFKFLGLIDGGGIPDPLLAQLVLEKDKRKAILKGIIEAQYPNVASSDFATMSIGQLEGKLGDAKYNVSGATRQKARTFLVKAAEFAEIPLSKLLTSKQARKPRTNASKPKPNATGQTTKVESVAKDEPPQPEGSTHTVFLRGGGTLTLSLAVNVFKLRGEDQKFVFGLINQLEAYERGSKSSTEETDKVEKEAEE